MQQTLFLDTTTPIFAAWLEQYTRGTYERTFPTERGRISLDFARFEPARGLARMAGFYITPVSDTSEQAIPLEDIIVFQVVPLAPGRIEVTARCDNPVVHPYLAELLSEIERRWIQPNHRQKELEAEMPTPTLAAPDEVLARKFEQWQKDFFDDVDSAFSRHDRPAGTAAFSSWEQRFIAFLEADAPTLLPIYRKNVKMHPSSRLGGLTEHQNWKRNKGDAVEAFLAQSIKDARAGRLTVTSPAKAVAAMESSPTKPFISAELIAQLMAAHKSPLDTSRLIRYCEEIDDNYARRNYSAVVFLSRAILAHCPPAFHEANFDSVVAHIEGRSSKAILTRLSDSLKNIADHHIHRQISKKEVPPIAEEIDFSNELNHLLSRIVEMLDT
jgi:hypothetical protein